MNATSTFLDDARPPQDDLKAAASADNDKVGGELRRQEVIVTLGRRAISPLDLSILMSDAAGLAAEAIGAAQFSVAELHPQEAALTIRMGSVGRRTSDEIEEYKVDLGDVRSVHGSALAAGDPVLINNLPENAQVRDPLLTTRGVTSALVCPLVHLGHRFGALGVYHTGDRSFRREDALFLESITHLLTTTLARQLAEQTLAEQSQQPAAVWDAVETPIVVISPDSKVTWINKALARLTGYELSELEGRQLAGALLIPEEAAAYSHARSRLGRGETPVRMESYILAKSGDRRRIQWSFTTIADSSGDLRSIVATGIDVSEKLAILRELNHVKKEAERITKTLGKLEQEIEHREMVFDANGTPTDSDRRRRKRRPYPYEQSVAPYSHGALPNRKTFFSVRCHDISPIGFSFLSTSLPTFDQIVVAFGAPPSVIYLIAETVHVTPYEHGGEDMYLVGCRYLSRAAY